MSTFFPVSPPIDYTSKDYAAIRQDMLDTIALFLPDWTSRSPNDFGIVLIELFAAAVDRVTFYEDRVANEAFLATAVQRSSVLAIAAMLDYRPTDPLAATVTLTFLIQSGVGAVTIPKGTQVSTATAAGQAPLVFETNAALVVADSGLHTGTVVATQGVTYSNEALGTSTGYPGQIFLLFHTSVIEGSTRVFVDEGAGPVEWNFVDHLLDAGATDNSFTTMTDENGVLNVKFGDGVNGRIPPVNATISSTYRSGGGSAGNVGAGALVSIVTPITNVISVTNASGAQGGADAETLDQIRVNAPRALGSLNRAVTLKDYASLAVRVSGVSKAAATASVYTSVTLYLAVAPGGGTASAGVIAAVQSYLTSRKFPGVTVTILDATYVPIYITVSVTLFDDHKQSVVANDVTKALKSLLSFDHVNFGQRVTISDIYRTLMAVDGVSYASVTVLSRSASGLADIALAANEIPTTDDAHLSITTVGGIS